MEFLDALILSSLAGIVGGAVGARLANADAWRGAVIIVVATIASFLVLTMNGWLALLAWLIGAGIAGGALKLSGRQMGSAVLGYVVFAFAAGLLASFFGGRPS